MAGEINRYRSRFAGCLIDSGASDKHAGLRTQISQHLFSRAKIIPPKVVRSWQQNRARVIPMFSFAPEIRKAIDTTNAIESLNMTLRKIIKNWAMFPSDEAVFKILYLALKNISKRWTMPIQNSQRSDESIRHTF